MWNTKEMSQQDAALTGVLLALTFDFEFLRSNRISGMGGPIVMERKGWESIGCPDVKDNHYVTSRQSKLLGTGVTFRRLILVDVDLTRLRYLKKGSYTPVFIHFMYIMHVASAWKVITLICVNLAKFHKNGKSNKNENTSLNKTL